MVSQTQADTASDVLLRIGLEDDMLQEGTPTGAQKFAKGSADAPVEILFPWMAQRFLPGR